ncbi:hypothetical protein IWX63_003099 [Arthrobacter sp. CAN_A2]
MDGELGELDRQLRVQGVAHGVVSPSAGRQGWVRGVGLGLSVRRTKSQTMPAMTAAQPATLMMIPGTPIPTTAPNTPSARPIMMRASSVVRVARTFEAVVMRQVLLAFMRKSMTENRSLRTTQTCEHSPPWLVPASFGSSKGSSNQRIL